jgi:hypothetical protein
VVDFIRHQQLTENRAFDKQPPSVAVSAPWSRIMAGIKSANWMRLSHVAPMTVDSAPGRFYPDRQADQQGTPTTKSDANVRSTTRS